MIDKTISPLRQRMIEDMTIRHFKEKVQKDYIRHVRNFTVFLGRSPTSWSAVVRLETPDKESPSRFLPTATLPSWAGLLTARRRGSLPGAMVSGPSSAASSSAPRRSETPPKASLSRCQTMAKRHGTAAASMSGSQNTSM
jgi:hypothetical protein